MVKQAYFKLRQSWSLVFRSERRIEMAGLPNLQSLRVYLFASTNFLGPVFDGYMLFMACDLCAQIWRLFEYWKKEEKKYARKHDDRPHKKK